MKSDKTVSIIFHEEAIARLFAALLSSLKINNRVLNSPTEIFESDLIITEKKYYKLISELRGKKCIVVSNEAVESADAIYLERPLSEDKVMEAIDNLLS